MKSIIKQLDRIEQKIDAIAPPKKPATYSVQDAAMELGVTYWAVRRIVAEGKLTPIHERRKHSRMRFASEEIERAKGLL